MLQVSAAQAGWVAAFPVLAVQLALALVLVPVRELVVAGRPPP